MTIRMPCKLPATMLYDAKELDSEAVIQHRASSCSWWALGKWKERTLAHGSAFDEAWFRIYLFTV